LMEMKINYNKLKLMCKIIIVVTEVKGKLIKNHCNFFQQEKKNWKINTGNN